MNTLRNSNKLPHDLLKGKTTTEKLSRENFGLIALQCLHGKPAPAAQRTSMLEDILSKTAEKTLKQLYPRTMTILWALQPSQLGNGLVDWDYLYQEATDQYC